MGNHDQFVDKIYAFKSEMESFATKSTLKLSITAQQQLEIAMNAIHKLEQILRKQPVNLERRAKQGHNVSFVASDDDGKENDDDNLLMDCVDDSSNDDSTNNILGSLFL